MVIQIWVDNQNLDLHTDINIKHTRQVNDISRVKDRQASYTNTFTIPKTPHNVQVFQGLGIPSDTSKTPYLKRDCKLKIDGFDFINKGWAYVTETNENYKLYVLSGVVNFFKAIENKTLGDEGMGISADLDHLKDVDTVVDSFDNENYRYLIADYNGLTHYGKNDEIINIDYLVPSVRVKYLFDKLHQYVGFEPIGSVFNTEAFENLWLTFPKYISTEIEETLQENSGFKKLYGAAQNEKDKYIPLPVYGYELNRYFIAPKTGKYRLTFHAKSAGHSGDLEFRLYKNKTNVPVENITSMIDTDQGGLVNEGYYYLGTMPNSENYDDVQPLNITEDPYLEAGDILYLYAYNNKTGVGYNGARMDYTLKWEYFYDNSAKFSEELKKLTITEFVKEVINQFGLTMFTDEFSNTIEYLTIEDRINNAEVLDWTEKYINRDSETYVYESYAQKNIFSYQYNDKESDHNDASIIVQNQNLAEKKEAFKSKLYSPEKNATEFKLNATINRYLPVFPFYDKQVKDKNGVVEIEYKGLEKRFHFVRTETLQVEATLGSQNQKKERQVSALPLANFNGLTWGELIRNNYTNFNSIIQNSRLHKISLNLNYADLLTLDFKQLFYFKQEQQYYILNKLTFDDKSAKGEFVKVSKYYKPIDNGDVDNNKEFRLNIIWEAPKNKDTRIGTKTDEYCEVDIQNSTYDKFVSCKWQYKNGAIGSWTFPYDDNQSYHVSLTYGVNEIRLQGITPTGEKVYSNVLVYNRGKCKNYSVVRPYEDDYDYEYYDCDGAKRKVQVSGSTGPARTVCALEGTIIHNGRIIDNGNC